MLTNAHDRPRIGIPFRTAAEEAAGHEKAQKIEYYYSAVEAAGAEGVPVSLNLTPEERARLAATLDGVVLPGSPADVDPEKYGAARRPECLQPDAARERTDYALLEYAFAEGKPVLAICYGTQLLNVFLGGSLYQDIPGELPSPILHSKDGLPKGAADPVHAAWIEPGGEIAQLAAACGLEKSSAGFEVLVNSSHHQAIREPGRGLRVTARAPDGVIEAVEHSPHKHWVVGVQWHPERMAGDALAGALFRALVQATRAASARR